MANAGLPFISFCFYRILNKISHKIDKKSYIYKKHKPTLRRVPAYVRWQKWNFCRSLEKLTAFFLFYDVLHKISSQVCQATCLFHCAGVLDSLVFVSCNNEAREVEKQNANYRNPARVRQHKRVLREMRGDVGKLFVLNNVLVTLAYALEESFKSSTIPFCLSELYRHSRASQLSYPDQLVPRTLFEQCGHNNDTDCDN